MATKKSTTERFFDNVMPVPWSGCWLWMASTFQNGYGVFALGGNNKRAHRVSWEIHYGPIPDGMRVLHRCDVPPCVNPYHLFLGTDLDNARDRDAKMRGAHGARHHSSKLTPENAENIIYLREQGLSLSVIAARFGVTKQRVWQLENRIKCKHLL